MQGGGEQDGGRVGLRGSPGRLRAGVGTAARGSPGGQVVAQLPLGAHHQVLADAARLLLHPLDVLRDVRQPLEQAAAGCKAWPQGPRRASPVCALALGPDMASLQHLKPAVSFSPCVFVPTTQE